MEPANNTTPSFPPLHVGIVGALILASGVVSVIKMVGAPFFGTPLLDPFVLAVPVGYGIIRGSSLSRKVAVTVTILSLFIWTVLTGLKVYDSLMGGKSPINFGGGTEWMAWIYLGLAVLLFLYILWALSRNEHRDWFESPRRNSRPIATLAWTAFALTLVFVTPYHIRNQLLERDILPEYSVDVQIAPFHADTGLGLPSVSYQPPPATRLPSGRLFEGITSVWNEPDGPQLRMRGRARGGVDVTLSAPGFKTTMVQLGPQTEGMIRVPMTPLATSAPAD